MGRVEYTSSAQRHMHDVSQMGTVLRTGPIAVNL